MKKVFSLLFIMILGLTFFGCNKPVEKDEPKEQDEPQEQKEESKIKIVDNNYILEFSNEYLDVIISKANGNINQIKNKKTGRDYIEDSEGGNFSVRVDTSTNNPFYTDTYPDKIYTISSRDYKPTITYKNDKDLEIKLTYYLDFESYIGLVVEQTITMGEDDENINIDYKVENGIATDSVVISFTGLIVSGIKDKEQELDLLYPRTEGRYYENAVYLGRSGGLKINLAYPSPISMQLMELYCEDDALYYVVLDNTREYKTFNFGNFTDSFDKGVESNNDVVSMSVTQYPYISKGNMKNLFTTVIGVSADNSWYDGADLYREFLLDSKMNREYNDFVSTWTGVITTTIANFGDAIICSYTGNNNPAEMVKAADRYGVDTILLMGWHQGGFDSSYPDYEFYDGEDFNGKEGFTEMVNEAHENGDKIVPYINGYMTCLDSKWGQTMTENGHTNLENGVFKMAGFRSNVNDYISYTLYDRYTYISDSATNFYYMCPCDEAWQDKLCESVQELVDCGVDGLWLDQVLEMPAKLCYDESHGHTNPATAFAEGFSELLSKFDQIFKDAGKTDYVIFSEGITDAYMEWIDIAGLEWRRLLHNNNGSYETYPEFTEYTIPEKQLGISGNSNRVHAYAFLYASPFIDGNNNKDYECTKVYQDNPDIYFDGRFMDVRGLDIDNDNIIGSLIIASDEKSLGIQLYNLSVNDEQTATITIDLSKLTLDGNIVSAVNLFTGIEYTVENNKIVIKLLGDELTSIRIVFE